jgi:putative phosphonate metabolism protein
MTQHRRYAVYYAPRPGAFATAAAHWLGRDAESGDTPPQPAVAALGDSLPAITAEPRSYGFHGTIRAPFRAANGLESDVIAKAVKDTAARLAPARCDGLEITNLHGFFALTPTGDTAEITALAAGVVEQTNPLRAPLSPDEIARRNPDRLSAHQRTLLDLWGYPYVMDQFRFHLTLSCQLAAAQQAPVHAAIQAHFATVLPVPFVIEDLCLFGEDAQTRQFHLLHRYPLLG